MAIGVTWEAFVSAAPSLAAAGAAQLFQFEVGLAYLATVRADGSPRLHPVCPVLSGGRLYVLIQPGSPKRGDLERDGRYAMQAFAQPRPDSDEFYLDGTAEVVADAPVRSRVLADARHHASEDEVLFELRVRRAMRTTWHGFGTPDYRSVHEAWTAP